MYVYKYPVFVSILSFRRITVLCWFVCVCVWLCTPLLFRRLLIRAMVSSWHVTESLKKKYVHHSLCQHKQLLNVFLPKWLANRWYRVKVETKKAVYSFNSASKMLSLLTACVEWRSHASQINRLDQSNYEIDIDLTDIWFRVVSWSYLRQLSKPFATSKAISELVYQKSKRLNI